MKFYDLIQKHTWKDIRDAIVRLYPDYESELEGYQQVFQKLKTLTPAKTSLRLLVDLVYSEHAGEFHVEVRGVEPSDENSSPTSFAIGTTSWTEWLGMELDENALKDFSEFDIVAFCLYEMTFFGFTVEDIQRTADAMIGITNEE
jgi:hypothetical protein